MNQLGHGIICLNQLELGLGIICLNQLGLSIICLNQSGLSIVFMNQSGLSIVDHLLGVLVLPVPVEEGDQEERPPEYQICSGYHWNMASSQVLSRVFACDRMFNDDVMYDQDDHYSASHTNSQLLVESRAGNDPSRSLTVE